MGKLSFSYISSDRGTRTKQLFGQDILPFLFFKIFRQLNDSYRKGKTLIFKNSFIILLHNSSLLTFHFSLLTFHFSLFTPHFSLFTPHFSLFTFHFSLFTPHFSLFTPLFSLLTFHFSLLTFHFSLFTSHFSLLSHSLCYFLQVFNIFELVDDGLHVFAVVDADFNVASSATR